MAETSHKLPFTDISIRMPGSDVVVALVTVCLFLPAVVLVHNLFTLVLVRRKLKAR